MNIEQVLLNFRTFLRNSGKRYTPEREALIRFIFEGGKHFDADELFVELKQKKLDISRATVYRTLELLEKTGFIRKSDFGEKHFHYEGVFDDSFHDHLICSSCGKVLEFSDAIIDGRLKQICRNNKFNPKHRSLQIYGVCNEC